MSTTIDQAEPSAGRNRTARATLHTWIVTRASPLASAWLDAAIAGSAERRNVDIAFGMAPRKMGRDALKLTSTEKDQAEALVPGWRAKHLRIDEAARLVILLAGLDHEPDTLTRLIRHADVDEQCAIYRGLCLLPDDTATVDVVHDVVGRGLRTHATPVFESIAHDNPWTATHFDEHRWNHLVLKAMFMEVALWPIKGFDERRNPELSRMALDFAAERRAADRALPDELFRCVAPYATLDQVERYLPNSNSSDGERWPDTATTRAVSLSLIEAEDAALREYVATHSPHVDAIASGSLEWSNHSSDTDRN